MSEQNTNKPETYVLKCTDRELLFLARHLYAKFEPSNLQMQQEFNLTFHTLGLDQFIRDVKLKDVSADIKEHHIPINLTLFLMEALNRAMNGATTRMIGAGTAFFARLVSMAPTTETMVTQFPVTEQPNTAS